MRKTLVTPKEFIQSGFTSPADEYAVPELNLDPSGTSKMYELTFNLLMKSNYFGKLHYQIVSLCSVSSFPLKKQPFG